MLCGVFSSGIISDRIGRTRTMMIMLTFVIICGSLTAFAPIYELFLVGIWTCGFSAIGLGTVMYVWVMEILSGKEKTIFGALPHLNFAFWGLAVAGTLKSNFDQTDLTDFFINSERNCLFDTKLASDGTVCIFFTFGGFVCNLLGFA